MVVEEEELRRRNEELEREVREARAELERMRSRLSFIEEAEERLCVQLGELEADAVEHALAYRIHIKALSDELALARRVLGSAGLSAMGVNPSG